MTRVDSTISAPKESAQTAQSESKAEKGPTPQVEDTTTQERTPAINITSATEEKYIDIETDIVHMRISTAKGGNPVVWDLKKYNLHSGKPVDLINQNWMKINFLNTNGKEINLNDYNFFTDVPNGKKVRLDESTPEYELQYYLPISNGKIIKTIHFYRDKYSFDITLEFENLQNYVINRRVFVGWENGVPPTEQNIKDDLNYSRAYAFLGDDIESIDASDKYTEKDYNGKIDWVAVRSKYFLASIIPLDETRTDGAIIGGVRTKEEKKYNITIEAQFEPIAKFTNNFRIYLGPLDYYILKKYDVGLQDLVMNKDWYERLFRPISLLIIPAFKFLYRFIPNYGLVIIVFSILIKLLLHPLTKKSYQSMSEMQFLQPKMTEMREKYKNDPQRLNKEMMKLYKERGKPFFLWINDLSAPDVLHLGVNLPLVGNSIHVLPVLMGITMIWQSKMSMTDPKQKMMIYFMPIFMIFIFYSLPSGLNLYYAVFNILSMIQTGQIKKKMHPGDKTEIELAENKPTLKQSVKRSRKKS
ncbi:MAG: membrane protein insertase YidC [Calditrichota bacterium]